MSNTPDSVASPVAVHVEGTAGAVEDGVDMGADQRGGALAEKLVTGPGQVIRQVADIIPVVVHDNPAALMGGTLPFSFAGGVVAGPRRGIVGINDIRSVHGDAGKQQDAR